MKQILNDRKSSLTGLLFGSFFLFTGIALGAMGAHLLEKKLGVLQLKTFKTGVTYQIYHGLGLLLLSLIQMTMGEFIRLGIPIYLLISGVFLFSFNCYFYALSGIKGFALAVPLGGVLFILGWFWIFCKFLKIRLAAVK